MENEMKEMNEKIVENPFKDDGNFDEAIPMQIRKERTTEAQKDNMDKDIETVEKNENSKQIFQKLNGEQYMRLQIKIILKIQIYFQLLLSNNLNYFQMNHSSYHRM